MIVEMLSPVGALSLRAHDGKLCGVHFGAGPMASEQDERTAPTDADAEVIARSVDQLQEYFAGRRQVFELPLAPLGTPFQLKVWQLLAEIPYGQTRSYGELAKALGDANKSRAVGMANGRNPIPIILPCHRVIGSSGALVGFGGGLAIKRALLLLEAPSLFQSA
jgi:methylated-DNA-[protein]-cysteine S-methyltransferase